MSVTNKLVYCIFLAVILVGCDSKPGDSDIEKNLRTLYECKAILVENVKKTNGKEVDKNNYDVEFSYDIRFNINMADTQKISSSDPESGDNFVYKLLEECSLSSLDILATSGFTRVFLRTKKDEIKNNFLSSVPFEGRVTMEKTENGWRMADNFQSEMKSIK